MMVPTIVVESVTNDALAIAALSWAQDSGAMPMQTAPIQTLIRKLLITHLPGSIVIDAAEEIQLRDGIPADDRYRFTLEPPS